MGFPKGLVKNKNEYWINQQIKTCLKLGIGNIIVVLGHHASPYLKVIETFGINITINPTPELGPFSSLQVGLKMLKPFEQALILPIDVPAPNPEFAGQLLKPQGGEWVRRPKGGGHPIAIFDPFIKKLLNQPPSSRLDFEIQKINLEKIKEFEVPGSMHKLNLNTPEAFQNYQIQF
jgi:CTP:molybdopterin cytidylyltransferase MocA